MAEYIDKELAIEGMWAGLKEGTICGPEDTETFLRSLPAADVEPVVRCKDCSHCYHGELCLACLFWHRMTNPNFYCQYGQKMDGEV